MREIIQDAPDPDHEPEVGDQYIDRVTGVVVSVSEVTEDRVRFKARNGWGASMDRERFKNTSRRIIQEGVNHGKAKDPGGRPGHSR